MRKAILILSAMLICSLSGFAQSKNSAKLAQIKGYVLESTQGQLPVSFATVQLSPQGVYATTDVDGFFEIKNVEPGQTSFNIQFIGMVTIDTTINLTPGKVHELVFKMKEASFRLEDVTVTATQSKAGKATASQISRQAMDHLQTSSIKDIMQLLPGAEMENSDLSKSNTFQIRTISDTESDNKNLNALGTSIIIDGSPLSNNANMQSLAPTVSGGGAAVGGGTSPNSGVDLRIISTDNIESVEVIRGIASVEYGDMTSGVVSIKRKTGVEPLRIQFKVNPFTYQASLSKGLKLGKKGGTLNLSADYAYNTTEQTEAYAYYQRVSVNGVWAKMVGNLSMNTSLNFNYGNDTRERNPDDIRSQIASGAKETGFRVATNGIYSPSDAGWLKSLKYNVSFSYTDKHSFYEELTGNAFAPYLTSVNNGAILTNKPGQKVYDNNGKEITNISSDDMGNYATYLPNEYFSHYDVYGKELNLYAKLTASFNKRWEKVNNSILVGADYKMDGNLGDGTVYDLDTPPMRASNNAAYRPRKFSDIPFIHQLGVYAEDSFTATLGKRDLNITAGARFDLINSLATVTPRINASFDIVPKKLTIRGGYGINAKAPTALYLYPQDAFFDYVNFNNLGDENVPENEQLIVGTTRRYNVENKDLKIAKNHKAEVGLSWSFNKDKMKIYLTAYQEKLKDGYSFGKDLNRSFNLIPYDVYEIYEENPGAFPTLALANSYNIFAMANTPMNSIFTTNKGLEYEIDLGRINAIRTSFYINGAWMNTTTRDMNHSYSTAKDGNNIEAHIGVYDRGKTTYCREKINTRFMITHNIPKIGFVATLTANVDWKTKIWEEYHNDTMFKYYISYKDGKVHDFDPSKKDDPEFAYLFPSLSDTRFIAETYFPVLTFNFQLSKEIGNFLTASFFVNNLFNSRPLYESKQTPGYFTELGTKQFFGFDLKINIK